ncbi:MAG: tyrosine--tRNA ligase [Myxococcota bacterium]
MAEPREALSAMPTVKSAALQELADRGFIEQLSDGPAIDEALASGVVTYYVGFDPTAQSLHVGNLVCVMAMRILQRHGHKPIVLVGGGTARIGDPSGRNEMRKMLDESTIDDNVQRIGALLRPFLDFDPATPHGATLVDNAKWLVAQRYVEFLRDVGVHFTVNRMLATKTYRDRLDNEQPLSFLEFNYQLLQAYDFLHLYREQQCSLQLGGSDQWGNMIAGVELIRRVTDHPTGHAHCLTWPLLTMSDGRKMGKTQRGAVWISAEHLSVFDYYQYWVSCDDRDVRKLMLIFTDLPVAEIDTLCQAEGAALREVKARLAYEATAIAHGAEAAERAQTAAKQAFGGGGDWSAVPTVTLPSAPIRLLELVVHDAVKAFASKRQARQRIESGAVKIDGVAHTDPAEELGADAFGEDGLKLQAGKKHRFRVVVQPG